MKTVCIQIFNENTIIRSANGFFIWGYFVRQIIQSKCILLFFYVQLTLSQTDNIKLNSSKKVYSQFQVTHINIHTHIFLTSNSNLFHRFDRTYYRYSICLCVVSFGSIFVFYTDDLNSIKLKTSLTQFPLV